MNFDPDHYSKYALRRFAAVAEVYDGVIVNKSEGSAA